MTLPDWITYPEADWHDISPAEAGMDLAKWDDFLAKAEIRGGTIGGVTHPDGSWGAVLARGGYRVQTWGNGDYRHQTASLGKAFMWALLGLAVEAGMVRPDDPINRTWTGEGLLSHPHKYLDQGHHTKLAWHHLLGRRDAYEHRGGFPVTNGYYWRERSWRKGSEPAVDGIPDWVKWTGDPFYDNYSHAEPDTVGTYSSGGLWRLAQSLTVLFKQDLKRVLDERLFGNLGIAPERWDWLPGKAVFDNKDFYLDMPGYGDFIDPPYEIDGSVVRGGPGWVVMSANDLARYGHLIATQGVWRGERLIGSQWLRGHHGGRVCQVSGESKHHTAMGRVITTGIDHPLPSELFAGPVRVGMETGSTGA